jgi:GAF domain-containing protein/HAMP domain-containing protein
MAKRFNALSLRARLFILLLLLTMIPAAIMSIMNERSNRSMMTRATRRTLAVSASHTAARLEAWFAASQESIQENAISLEFLRYLGLPEGQRAGSEEEGMARARLEALNAKSFILTGSLLDMNGKVWLDTSHPDTSKLAAYLGLDPADLKGQSSQAGRPYLSPILFPGDESQASLFMAALVKSSNNDHLGWLVLRFDAAILQAQVAPAHSALQAAPGGPGSFTMLFDENGLRLADSRTPDPARRLLAPLEPGRIEQLQASGRLPRLSIQELIEEQPDLAKFLQKPPLDASGFETRLARIDSVPEVMAGAAAPLQSMPWLVITLQPQSALLSPVIGQNRMMALVALSMVVATVIATVYLTRSITRHITILTRTAERITSGDLWVQAPESEGEIGALARALNIMTTELRRTLASMEQTIAERTSELAQVSEQMKKRASHLQTIAEVAHAIASVQNPEELLRQITQRISERFGFYHVGIFLLDPTGAWAVLQAANSEGGQRMLARGHKLSVSHPAPHPGDGSGDPKSIVGYVTGQGEPRVALDVGTDAVYFDNPDLPYTRSELALPLKVGDRVFGALDVQSMEPSAFQEEDVALLNILADQVAIAIENTRLYSQTRDALSELQTLHRQYLRGAWAAVVSEQRKSGFAYEYGKITPVTKPGPADLWEAIDAGQILRANPPAQADGLKTGREPHAGHDKNALIVPIAVRDQVIGMLSCTPGDRDPDDEGQRWTEEEINLVKTVADQVGLAIENARLLEETQRRAEREHLVSEITSRLRASNDPQVILQTAASELRQALRAKHAEILLPTGSPEPTGQEDPLSSPVERSELSSGKPDDKAPVEQRDGSPGDTKRGAVGGGA